MIETMIVLLNFAFKWLKLVNDTRTIGLVQAAKQSNQLCWKLRKQNFFCVCYKKGVLRKHPICENNTYACFHQGHNWKNELLLARAFFVRSVLS